jgi:hypothetical protein
MAKPVIPSIAILSLRKIVRRGGTQRATRHKNQIFSSSSSPSASSNGITQQGDGFFSV